MDSLNAGAGPSTSRGDVPWTAARCNRLLRQLTSKLASIRRHAEAQRSEVCTSTDKIDYDGLEPKWTGSSATRLKKTYKSRRIVCPHDMHSCQGRADGLSFGRSNITLPTPFHRRNNERTECSGCGSRPNEQSRHEVLDSPSSRKAIARALPSTEHTDPSPSIVTPFLSVIQNTRMVQDQRLSSPSLLSTCLRKVPAFIKKETERRKADDADDKSDVSSEVYQELECLFSTTEGSGWDGLRTIVRAHAIRMMQDAFDSGLLSPSLLFPIQNSLLVRGEEGVLVELSGHTFKRAHSRPYAKVHKNALRPVWCDLGRMKASQHAIELNKVVNIQSRFNQATNLISELAYPVHPAFKADSGALWNAAVRSITGEGADYVCAIRFLETSFLVAAGYHRSLDIAGSRISKQRMKYHIEYLRGYCQPFAVVHGSASESSDCSRSPLLDVCAVITVISIGRKASIDTRRSSGNSTPSRCVRGASLSLLRFYQRPKNIKMAIETAVAPMAAMILMADLTISIHDHIALYANEASDGLMKSRISVITLLCAEVQSEGASTRLHAVHLCARILSTIAQICDKCDGADGFPLLKLVADHLRDYDSCTKEEAYLMKWIATEAMLAYSGSSSDPQHVAYAGELKKSMSHDRQSRQAMPSVKRKGPSTPALDSFRWEEGICEWVKATPNVLQTLRKELGRTRKHSTNQQTPLPRLKADLEQDELSVCGLDKENVHRESRKRQRSLKDVDGDEDEEVDELALG